ncbi:hypothetical protein SD78_2888 [Bacillus badius]|nr:hypothetical protein SD78_2888 [Bacillus badius]
MFKAANEWLSAGKGMKHLHKIIGGFSKNYKLAEYLKQCNQIIRYWN